MSSDMFPKTVFVRTDGAVAGSAGSRQSFDVGLSADAFGRDDFVAEYRLVASGRIQAVLVPDRKPRKPRKPRAPKADAAPKAARKPRRDKGSKVASA